MKLCFDSNPSPIKTPRGQEKFFYPMTVTPASSSKDDEPRKDAASDDPVVQLGMNFDDVKHRTGFRSESMLLAFVFLVCEGDADLIRRRSTPLTWYEEWFFFAEMMYGRSFVKWWQTTTVPPRTTVPASSPLKSQFSCMSFQTGSFKTLPSHERQMERMWSPMSAFLRKTPTVVYCSIH